MAQAELSHNLHKVSTAEKKGASRKRREERRDGLAKFKTHHKRIIVVLDRKGNIQRAHAENSKVTMEGKEPN